MWHQPKNLNKEVYNKIGTNFVTSFHYYMWNAWCKDECKKVFPELYLHFWGKWEYLTQKHSALTAISAFYAEISDEYRYNLVSRAIELYDGRKKRQNLQKDLKSSNFVNMKE